MFQPTPQLPKWSEFSAVSCPPGGDCTAVGMYFNGTEDATLAEHWNGTKWAKQATPSPAGDSAELTAASCAPGSGCLAVGDYEALDVYVYPLVESWDGSTWVQLPAPATPPGTTADGFGLDGVSCPAPSDCIVVGWSAHPGDRESPLAESWDGTSWTILPTGRPAHVRQASLAGVSCTSPSACTAVGTSSPVLGQFNGLAERWNGTRWIIQHLSPAAGPGVELSGVSCTAGRTCMAVGYTNGDDSTAPVAEQWTGGHWSTRATPDIGTSGSLSSVSCSYAVACTAVGDYVLGTSFYALAEHWNGSTWKRQITPWPNRGTALDSVACLPASGCTAAGEAPSLHGHRRDSFNTIVEHR